MGSRVAAGALCLAFAGAGFAGVASAATAYSDVPSDHWADDAVRAVAEDRNWMRFSGDLFHPSWLLSRRVLARAVVRAFAPLDLPDATIEFSDLPADDSFYSYASVAVERGWMKMDGGKFDPDGDVSKRSLDRTLVRALGLTAEARALGSLATEDGDEFSLPTYFPYLVLAEELGLNYNFPAGSESRDYYPWNAVNRAYAAYALDRAASAAGSWRVWSLERYRSIMLPDMSDGRRKVVTFALAYAGYPYVYAGEWYRRTPGGYCCGSMPQGGFDCSGFVWWVMKEPGGGYDNTSIRPYDGWDLPERASRYMAQAAPARYELDELRVMDLMFFDTDDSGRGWDDVDHVGLFLGKGWMIHSSGSRGGVTISWVGDGWWADQFDWGRRLIGT